MGVIKIKTKSNADSSNALVLYLYKIMVQDFIECSNCGTFFDNSLDTLETLAPCPHCGSDGRVINASVSESVTLRDGLGVKAKRLREKRPYFEDKGVPSFSHSLEKFVFHVRIIDRDNDRYFERVTDFESGEVIHLCDEPLSEHFGHGSAKINK